MPCCGIKELARRKLEEGKGPYTSLTLLPPSRGTNGLQGSGAPTQTPHRRLNFHEPDIYQPEKPSNNMDKNVGSRARLPEFKSLLCYLVAV